MQPYRKIADSNISIVLRSYFCKFLHCKMNELRLHTFQTRCHVGTLLLGQIESVLLLLLFIPYSRSSLGNWNETATTIRKPAQGRRESTRPANFHDPADDNSTNGTTMMPASLSARNRATAMPRLNPKHLHRRITAGRSGPTRLTEPHGVIRAYLSNDHAGPTAVAASPAR